MSQSLVAIASLHVLPFSKWPKKQHKKIKVKGSSSNREFLILPGAAGEKTSCQQKEGAPKLKAKLKCF